MIPMAVSLSFGVIFATTITLFLVPVGYLVLEKYILKTEKVKI
jgi:multidrug efflux pump subunit AcrB